MMITDDVPAGHERHTLPPEKIEEGDVLRDLGRYRLVASVTRREGPLRPTFDVAFRDGLGLGLGIPEGVDVTLWRALT